MRSAGLGTRGRVCGEQLVDALVRDAEDRGRVPHADPSAGEFAGGSLRFLEGEAVGVAVSGLAGLADGPTASIAQFADEDTRRLPATGLVYADRRPTVQPVRRPTRC